MIVSHIHGYWLGLGETSDRVGGPELGGGGGRGGLVWAN